MLHDNYIKRSLVKRALVLVSAILVFSFLLNVGAAYAASAGNNSGYVQRATMSKVAEFASVYIDNLFRTQNYDALVKGESSEFKGANAGGGLGYVPDDSELAGDGTGKSAGSYTFNFFNPTTTHNSVGYSYSALAPYNKSKANADQKNVLIAFTEYARYGHLLGKMGFDETGLPGNGFLRQASGVMLWITWNMANISQQVIGMVYKGLAYLNPLSLFVDGGDTTLFTDNATGTGGIRSFVKNLTNVAYGIGSWVVVPLLLALFVFMLTIGRVLFQSKFNWTRSRNLFARVVFIVAGVPLMAGAFFGAAGMMGDMFTTTDSNGTTTAKVTSFKSTAYDYVILQTLVDFKGWVESSNLNPPDKYFGTMTTKGVKSTGNGGSANTMYSFDVDPTTLGELRSLALGVNAEAHELGIDPKQATQSLVTGTTGGTNGTGGETRQYSVWSTGNSVVQGMSEDDQSRMRELAHDLIMRYMGNEQYLATDYDAYAKDRTIGKSDEAAANMGIWFAQAESMQQYADQFGNSVAMDAWPDVNNKDKGVFAKDEVFTHIAVTEDAVIEQLQTLWEQWLKDDITYSEYMTKVQELKDKVEQKKNQSGTPNNAKVKGIDWFCDGTMDANAVNLDGSGDTCSITYKRGTGFGLSTMSMYNYLTTSFTDSGMTVQGDRSVNEPSYASHKSVTSIGSGAYGAFALINTIVFLFAVGILGFVYGIGLLFTVLKNGITLILQIPFAVMGWLRGIARATLMFIGMIVEMFVCGYLYVFMAQMLALLPSLMVAAGNAVAGAVGSLLPAAGMIAAVTSLLIGTIILILFILLAIRARAIVLGAINSLLSGLVERIVGASGGEMSAAMPVESFMKGAKGAATGLGGLALAGGLLGANNALSEYNGDDATHDNNTKEGNSKPGSSSLTGDLEGHSSSTAEMSGGEARENTPTDQGIENETRQWAGLNDGQGNSIASYSAPSDMFTDSGGYDRDAAVGDGAVSDSEANALGGAGGTGDGANAVGGQGGQGGQAKPGSSSSSSTSESGEGQTPASSDSVSASVDAAANAESDSDANLQVPNADTAEVNDGMQGNAVGNAYYDDNQSGQVSADGAANASSDANADSDADSTTAPMQNLDRTSNSMLASAGASVNAVAKNANTDGASVKALDNGVSGNVPTDGAQVAAADAEAMAQNGVDVNGSAGDGKDGSVIASLSSAVNDKVGEMQNLNQASGNGPASQAGNASSDSTNANDAKANATGGASTASGGNTGDVNVSPELIADEDVSTEENVDASGAQLGTGYDGARDVALAVDSTSDADVSGSFESNGSGDNVVSESDQSYSQQMETEQGDTTSESSSTSTGTSQLDNVDDKSGHGQLENGKAQTGGNVGSGSGGADPVQESYNGGYEDGKALQGKMNSRTVVPSPQERMQQAVRNAQKSLVDSGASPAVVIAGTAAAARVTQAVGGMLTSRPGSAGQEGMSATPVTHKTPTGNQ